VADRRWRAWAAGVAAVVVAGFAIQAQNPPAALPAHAAAELFAAGRAQKHVEAIARAPHPMGSAESDRVRETLVQRLEEIGLKAEVQSPKAQKPPMPRNVLARIKGQGPPGKKTLMLCAHYDSVHEGPGASDNAAGVAVVLETLRALKSSPPLERDLIALLTDGEECGFDGSRLFVAEHPWAKEVGIVLNFDARGNSGPSIMFETSDGNGWLISQYGQAVLEPLATSLSMDVYKVLPNDTDLSVFKRAGMGGLNFAFGSGLAYYHTPEDTPENLDQRTLQHQGENALATARHLGRLDLDDTKLDDVIYTSVLNRIVLSYSKTWILPLALAALGLYLALVFRFIPRAEIGLAESLAGAGLFFVAIVTSLLAVGTLFLVGTCWSLLRDITHSPPIPWLKYDLLIMTGCALVSIGIIVAITRWWASSRPLEGLVLGAYAWWLGLTLATAFWLPGASYLFVWPTLGGLLGLSLSSRLPPGSSVAWVATFLGSIPALLLVAPLIRTTFEGLSLPMTAPIVVLVGLFTGAVMPLWGPLVVQQPELQLTPEREELAQVELEVEHASYTPRGRN
jgi:hypothetical protein